MYYHFMFGMLEGTIRLPTKSTVCALIFDWGSIDKEYSVFLEGKKGLKRWKYLLWCFRDNVLALLTKGFEIARPIWDKAPFHSYISKKPSGKGAWKKSKKKLTSVSFVFTHTYTLEKLTLLLLFSPSIHGNFEKCAKRKRKKHFISLHCPKNS